MPIYRNHRRGAMLPLVAVVIVILFVASALAIDIARMHVTRSELRTATDAAARAAIEALGREQNVNAARVAAIDAASRNEIAGQGLTLDASNIVFGSAQQNGDGSFTFSPGGGVINSVRIVGERTAGSADGPVSMFFGPMFDVVDFEATQVASATRLDRDIGLVLDISGSMGGSKLVALKNAVAVFIAELNASQPIERVSLVVYSTRAAQRLQLTENLNTITNSFNRERAGGFTAIGEGIAFGTNSVLNDPLSRPLALKSLVVMTDGKQNEGVSPITTARNAANREIQIHTITFGGGANQGLMQQIASIGNGRHLHADNNGQLVQVFRDIARQLQVLLIE